MIVYSILSLFIVFQLDQPSALVRPYTHCFTILDEGVLLTLSHACSSERLLGAAEAELPADDAGRLQVPAVVAHCPPLVVLQHLHAALARPSAALQPHVVLDDEETQ